MSKDVSPSSNVLAHAFEISVKEDKPIMTDYWTSSLENECFIGVRDNDEKLLVKNEDEYTSPISQIFKVVNEYIILTANSTYIVSCNIGSKKIE